MTASVSFSSQPMMGQGSTFSPLTMFECTISSATMLIDNMAVRDLLIAFKIVGQLHGHLLEVLDPTVQRLVNVADEHSLCPQPTNQSAPPAAFNIGGAGVGPGTSKLEKSEPSAAAAAAAASTGPGGYSSSVKPEALDSDDDCVLMEADLIFDNSGLGLGLGGGSQSATGGGGASAFGRGGGGVDSSGLPGGDLSNEWKGILRKAYRVLKDESGSNVFDFSLPYSARVNVLAANRVIDKALALSRQKPVNVDAWRNNAKRYFGGHYSKNLRTAYKMRKRELDTMTIVRQSLKLNRRQKSYELMKGELDEQSRVKFESVLTRDYTSSDEEGGADLDSEMKVRSLPWESGELSAMKRQLDEAYCTRLADDKQRAEIARLHRDPGVLSARPPPADSLHWARNPDWIAPSIESDN